MLETAEGMHLRAQLPSYIIGAIEHVTAPKADGETPTEGNEETGGTGEAAA
jgi:hypothetical protein